MESKYNNLALYGSKNECAWTDNVFFPISEVCDGTFSLKKLLMQIKASFVIVLTPDVVLGFHLKITPVTYISLFGFPSLSIAFHKIATKKNH